MTAPEPVGISTSLVCPPATLIVCFVVSPVVASCSATVAFTAAANALTPTVVFSVLFVIAPGIVNVWVVAVAVASA